MYSTVSVLPRGHICIQKINFCFHNYQEEINLVLFVIQILACLLSIFYIQGYSIGLFWGYVLKHDPNVIGSRNIRAV